MRSMRLLFLTMWTIHLHGTLVAVEEEAPKADPGSHYSHHAFRSVPEGAVVRLELDKSEYFLGENVLIHFVVENTSAEPFRFDRGGDYRGAGRSQRYRVTATDADGKIVTDSMNAGSLRSSRRYHATAISRQ